MGSPPPLRAKSGGDSKGDPPAKLKQGRGALRAVKGQWMKIEETHNTGGAGLTAWQTSTVSLCLMSSPYPAFAAIAAEEPFAQTLVTLTLIP